MLYFLHILDYGTRKLTFLFLHVNVTMFSDSLDM